MPRRLPPRAPALLAAILGLACLAPPAAALAARPAANHAAPPGAAPLNPSPSSLQAFVLAGAPDSFADLQAHVRQVGTIYPTYFHCAVPGGAVTGAGEPALDAYAAAHRLAELPRFTCQDGATVHRILTAPRLRARVFARLLALARAPGYAGLNLDLENDAARDRRPLSAFVAALAAALHAERRRLAVDVVGVVREDPRRATYLYDDRALAAAADTVFVIAWGVHWERSPPGPLAPLPYVRAVARRLAALPHARRFVLGVPMYGLDWAGRGGPPNPGRALQYAALSALARAVGAEPARDPASGEMTFAYTRAGVTHHVWYLDARAVAQRVAIARAYRLGAGLWRLGEEDQRVWGEPGV
ncbi:MAG TPA: glycosyl hydrolase family 18 protein [Solirubrobacteraceae bacterium]|nr:glycosyl hydrolase family 18 protein [Solirubrobacteraceae bacterium]